MSEIQGIKQEMRHTLIRVESFLHWKVIHIGLRVLMRCKNRLKRLAEVEASLR